MRDFFPSIFLRAELLKAIKYPEISYRKFCGDDNDYEGHKDHSPHIGMDNKQNRVFVGLPLNRKMMLSHVQMCQFRSGLTFSQLINLMVYILYHLRERGIFDEGFVHCVDSTELPVDRQQLLATLTIKGKKIRIYDDIDCDCGARKYIGVEEQGHEFKCDAQAGQCLRSELCPKYRHIPFDNGCFQRILYGSDAVSKALDIRKNGERPFNLLKKREGLEQVRVRSQHGLVARSTFTTMATLLIELAGTRKTKKANQKQLKLPIAI